MWKLVLVAILISAVASTGCVKSVNPYYETKDVYLDSSLVGVWTAADRKETWTVVSDDESYYVIDQMGEDGRKSRFEARLFKIGGHSFLDIVPVPAGDYINTDGYFDQAMPIHSLMAIKKERCSLRMSYFEPSWLKAYLLRSPNELRHADADGVLVLTDSAKNLQAFIKRHLNTLGAFEQTETLFKQGDTQCEQRTS